MKRIDKRTYPAIFFYNPEEGQEYKYTINFPDFPGCITEGKTLEHGTEMAQEALSLHIYGMEEDGDPMPAPSEHVHTGEDEVVVMITINMDAFREIMHNKLVKKTLVIPAKLNIAAENAGVNFSQVLTNALKSYLGME